MSDTGSTRTVGHYAGNVVLTRLELDVRDSEEGGAYVSYGASVALQLPDGTLVPLGEGLMVENELPPAIAGPLLRHVTGLARAMFQASADAAAATPAPAAPPRRGTGIALSVNDVDELHVLPED